MRSELARADSVRTGDYVQGWQQTTFHHVVVCKTLSDDELEIAYDGHTLPTGFQGLGFIYRRASDMIIIGRAE